MFNYLSTIYFSVFCASECQCQHYFVYVCFYMGIDYVCVCTCDYFIFVHVYVCVYVQHCTLSWAYFFLFAFLFQFRIWCFVLLFYLQRKLNIDTFCKKKYIYTFMVRTVPISHPTPGFISTSLSQKFLYKWNQLGKYSDILVWLICTRQKQSYLYTW